MSVITKNTKTKTDLIGFKILEYLNKHKKKLKKDNNLFELRKKDKRVKDHRIVFSKSELAEIQDLILKEKAKQIIEKYILKVFQKLKIDLIFLIL